MNKLPLALELLILDYASDKCEKCDTKTIECRKCEYYFCPHHVCFQHRICEVCERHNCPLRMFNGKECICDTNSLCKECYYIKPSPSIVQMLSMLEPII